MKLTAKVNGVQQEIELSKEDVYVVECGSVERANKVLKSVDERYESTKNWEYVSNKPIFTGTGYDGYDSFVANYEPIPPDTPIISFQDWERLMGEKELPKEFCFVCDENSREQLKRLGINYSRWGMSSYGRYFQVKNKEIVAGGYLGFGKDYDISNLPIISLADYLPTESDKEEPKPTKWRFKTQKEFDDTCEKNKCGSYFCGNDFFPLEMYYLFGKEYAGSPDNLIKHDNWNITPEMLMPLEEANYMIPNDPNWGKVKEPAPTQKWEKLTRGTEFKFIFKDTKSDNRINLSFDWSDIESMIEETIFERLEDSVSNCSCINESNNHCECQPCFEDFQIEHVEIIPLNRESILKEIEEHKQAIVELEKKLK